MDNCLSSANEHAKVCMSCVFIVPILIISDINGKQLRRKFYTLKMLGTYLSVFYCFQLHYLLEYALLLDI